MVMAIVGQGYWQWPSPPITLAHKLSCSFPMSPQRDLRVKQEFGAFLAKMMPNYGDSLLEARNVAKKDDVNEYLKSKASWHQVGGGVEVGMARQ